MQAFSCFSLGMNIPKIINFFAHHRHHHVCIPPISVSLQYSHHTNCGNSHITLIHSQCHHQSFVLLHAPKFISDCKRTQFSSQPLSWLCLAHLLMHFVCHLLRVEKLIAPCFSFSTLISIWLMTLEKAALLWICGFIWPDINLHCVWVVARSGTLDLLTCNWSADCCWLCCCLYNVIQFHPSLIQMPPSVFIAQNNHPRQSYKSHLAPLLFIHCFICTFKR